MIDKLFINGKIVVLNKGCLINVIKKTYWGIGFSLCASIFIQLGLRVYIKLIKKENLIKKRLFLLQKFIKKYFFFDRMLKRRYDSNIDFYVKNGHYKGLCLQMGLPVKGQRTHSNASIAGSLNRNRISSMLLMGGLRKTEDQRKKKEIWTKK